MGEFGFDIRLVHWPSVPQMDPKSQICHQITFRHRFDFSRFILNGVRLWFDDHGKKNTRINNKIVEKETQTCVCVCEWSEIRNELVWRGDAGVGVDVARGIVAAAAAAVDGWHWLWLLY